MPYGWTGKILRVDLSEARSWTEDTEPYTRLFIGGKGINIKIMFDEVGSQVNPFDPENRICFGPGVLAGTMAPSHSRMKITSMSPNGLLQNSGIGGYFPAEIRKAGYDALIIQGKSDKPVYLYIEDGRVELREGAHLSGKDTQETQRIMKTELGDWVKIACIGPAGENLVSFSCVVTGKGSAAGRGGFGAIMGSKNLKAIAVRGTGSIKIAKPAEFLSACKDMHQWFPEGSEFIKMQSRQGHGDKYTLGMTAQVGLVSLGNWEEKDTSWDRIGTYDGAEEFYEQFAEHQYGCFGCPVHHFHIFDLPGGGRGTTKCTQWNTFVAPVWVSDRRILVQANTLCQNYGLDSTSTCNAVSFLMELYYRGLISEKETDGVPMKRGDEKAIFTAIEKIAKQEGFGNLFRGGVVGAAKAIGSEAEECAMVVNKQEIEPFELRAFKSWALVAAVNDGSVSHGEPLIDVGWTFAKEKTEEQARQLFGSKEAAIPFTYEAKALSVWDQENRNTAADTLGTCRWLIPWGITHKLDQPAKLFSLATGRETCEEDILLAAQRILTLERAFRSRKGLRRDTLPKRFFETAIPDGIYKGEKLDREKFDKMLDEYFQLRGWDEKGIPKEDTFIKYGLASEWRVFREQILKDALA
jgi:aldehyde:ferredoxin oxidoreductase